MLEFLNIILHFAHIFLIIFNLFGWLVPRMRRAHLISILLVFISWFGLGIFYGWGYCPITDWHWQVQHEIGVSNLPSSYIKLLLDSIFSADIKPLFVDILTLVSFLLAFAVSIWINFFHTPNNRLIVK